MKEKIIISGFLHQTENRGTFSLERILKTAPRIFFEENSAYPTQSSQELGKVTGITQNRLIKNKYTLLVPETEIGLRFFYRGIRKDSSSLVVLSLPPMYFFGGELINPT